MDPFYAVIDRVISTLFLAIEKQGGQIGEAKLTGKMVIPEISFGTGHKPRSIKDPGFSAQSLAAGATKRRLACALHSRQSASHVPSFALNGFACRSTDWTIGHFHS